MLAIIADLVSLPTTRRMERGGGGGGYCKGIQLKEVIDPFVYHCAHGQIMS